MIKTTAFVFRWCATKNQAKTQGGCIFNYKSYNVCRSVQYKSRKVSHYTRNSADNSAFCCENICEYLWWKWQQTTEINAALRSVSYKLRFLFLMNSSQASNILLSLVGATWFAIAVVKRNFLESFLMSISRRNVLNIHCCIVLEWVLTHAYM